MSQELQGQIRMLLTMIGGVLVHKGWVDNETMVGGVGVVLAIIVGVWSWMSKSGYFSVKQIEKARVVDDEVSTAQLTSQLKQAKASK